MVSGTESHLGAMCYLPGAKGSMATSHSRDRAGNEPPQAKTMIACYVLLRRRRSPIYRTCTRACFRRNVEVAATFEEFPDVMCYMAHL